MIARLSLSSALLFTVLAAGCSSGESEPTGAGGTGGSGGASGTGGTGSTGSSAANPPTVMTDKGPVEGALLGSSRAYLGIPFAEPPLDALRWKPPAPAAAWTETMKATKKGPPCVQQSPFGGGLVSGSSEDCLTVNVWTPDKPARAALPVLVWIHGGGFTIGSGGDADYDGQHLSEASGSVVITLNYRLGPFGFLGLPELKAEDMAHPSTGNYGIEDQRAALAWVKANAAVFGGDPGNVTIFGESAGGISVCHHMVSPKSKGLFHRAIIESGPCDTVASEAAATAQGAEVKKALGCEGSDVLACLRGKSTEGVMNAVPKSSDSVLGGGVSFAPMLDGFNLPDLPSKLLKAGSFEKVPTIFGSNADEGSHFFVLASTTIPDDAAFEAYVDKFVPGHGKEVVSHYPSATYGSSQKAAIAAFGDGGFVCPTRRTARALVAAGAATFLYHFTYVPAGALVGNLGSFHSAELKFVFGNPGQLLPEPLTAEETELSASIMGYWSRHADKGDPNGGGALAWPSYDAQKDEGLVLDKTIATKAAFRKDLCDFWDSITPAP
jgi:para-nitrobenzyl esterase